MFSGLLTAVSMAVGIGAAAVVGHVSAELLGTLAYLKVIVAMIPTFCLLGGEAVLVKYIPAIPPQSRRPFLGWYSGLCVLLTLVMVVLFLNVKPAMDLLLQGAQQEALRLSFILLSLPTVGTVISSAYLLAMLHFRTAAFLSALPTIIFSVAVVAMRAFAPSLLRDAGAVPLTIAMFASYFISFSTGMLLVWRASGASDSRDTHVGATATPVPPHGFWGFVLALHLGAIGTFVFTRLDQILAVRWYSLEALATLFAVVQITQLSAAPVQILSKTFFPVFSHTKESAGEVRQVYQWVCRINGALTLVLIVPVIIWPDQVLRIFALSGQEARSALHLLCVGAISAATNQPSGYVALVHGKARWGLYNQVASLSAFVALLLALRSHGLPGIAMARVGGGYVGMLGAWAMAWRLERTVPVFTMARMLAITLLALMLQRLGCCGWASQWGLVILCLVLMWKSRLMTVEDVRDAVELVRRSGAARGSAPGVGSLAAVRDDSRSDAL